MTKQNIKDIISEKGAKNIANIIRKNLGNDIVKHLDKLGINAEEIIRYMPP